jgi:type I restriction enzyme R subunit
VAINDVPVALNQDMKALTFSGGGCNNTKEQFANSPDLRSELVNAIISALDAHTQMSQQALNSKAVQEGLKDILLNHALLWEALRARGREGSAG